MEHNIFDTSTFWVLSVSGIILGITIFLLWYSRRKILNSMERISAENRYLRESLVQSAKLAAVGKLAAGIVHEVNNPLMLIKQTAGWIKDLMEDESPDKMKNYHDLQEAAQKIEQHVDRTKDIVHRLLGFARKEQNIVETKPLGPLVEQTLDFLKNEAKFQDVRLEYIPSTEPLSVRVDFGQLQQVILNLVDNAIDAVGRGGKVTVALQKNDAYACIMVLDNGPGLSNEQIEHLFEPFFTTKAKGQGTGLGLPICRSIMQDMGGQLLAGNRKDGGAEFLACVPLSSL